MWWAFKALRELSSASIEKAAQVAGCSYGKMWNAERGLAKLDDAELAALQSFYFSEIQARLDRIEASLIGSEKLD